ncbi:MAG: PQQ-binding-like beta-propeller repeat protein [Armatimonas sp.]
MKLHWKRKALLLVTAVGTGITVTTAHSQGNGSAQWAVGGGDIQNSRFAANESKISAKNVAGLKTKWVFTPKGDISATPTVESQSVYVVDWGGFLHNLDANTGATNWSRNVTSYTGNPFGSVSRTSPAIHGNTIVLGDQGDFNPATPWAGFFPSSYMAGQSPVGKTASVIAVNKNTGALQWRTIVDDHPWSIVTASPVIHNGVVYVGISSSEEAAGLLGPFAPPMSFRGSLVALKESDGSILWKTYTCPAGYTGAAIWGSTPAVDVKRGTVYIATGNNYTVPDSVEASIAGDPAHGESYLAPNDWLDSVVALDLKSGAIKWGRRMWGADTWNVARGFVPAQFDPGQGPDYDFGSGPNLFTATIGNKKMDLVGAGEKSGQYHALNPDTGALVWSTQVGPGGTAGGIQWGSAVDGNLVYCAISNSNNRPTGLSPEKNAGLWAGLDAGTGAPVWKTVDPITRAADGNGGHDFGMVTVANGVVFAGSNGVPPLYDNPFAPTAVLFPAEPGGMFALDAATGAVLWSQRTDGAVVCGPSVVNGTVYWGTGYGRFGNAFGVSGTPKLYAFSLR